MTIRSWFEKWPWRMMWVVWLVLLVAAIVTGLVAAGADHVWARFAEAAAADLVAGLGVGGFGLLAAQVVVPFVQKRERLNQALMRCIPLVDELWDNRQELERVVRYLEGGMLGGDEPPKVRREARDRLAKTESWRDLPNDLVVQVDVAYGEMTRAMDDLESSRRRSRAEDPAELADELYKSKVFRMASALMEGAKDAFNAAGDEHLI